MNKSSFAENYKKNLEKIFLKYSNIDDEKEVGIDLFKRKLNIRETNNKVSNIRKSKNRELNTRKSNIKELNTRKSNNEEFNTRKSNNEELNEQEDKYYNAFFNKSHKRIHTQEKDYKLVDKLIGSYGFNIIFDTLFSDCNFDTLYENVIDYNL